MSVPVIKWPSKDINDRFGEDGELWQQGGYGDVDGEGPVCLYGAVRACCPVPGDAHIIERVRSVRGRGTSWNDFASFQEVYQWVATAGDITDADLYHTFGPQWRYIVSLVRASEELTEAKLERIGNLYTTESCKALGKLKYILRFIDNTRDLWISSARIALESSFYSKIVYTKTCLGGSLLNTVLATSTKDMIGTGEYTQEVYDTAMLPWVSVMGEVEPCYVPENSDD